MIIDRTHIKETLILAFPVMLSQRGHIAVGVTDTIMAGSISADALAAATVALSVFFPLFMLYIGFSYGFTPLISQANGEGDPEKIVRIFKHAILINAIVSIAITAILYTGTYFIPFLHQPENIVKDAIDFYYIMIFTIIPVAIFQIFKQFIEGLGFTRQAMVVSVTGNILNIILNIILVKGWWVFPAFGLMGVVYATFIARWIMAGMMIVYFFADSEYKIYRLLFNKVAIQWNHFRPIFLKSYPVGLQMSFESGAFSLAALFIGVFGTHQIAAHQIALNLASVTYMAASGLAAAATVRVGFEYGRKDAGQLRRAGISALILVVALMGAFSVMFMTLNTFLPLVYTNATDVIEIAAWLLWMTAFFQLSDGIQVVSMGALRGMGDVIIPSSIAFIAYWVIGLPVGWLLANTLGWEVYGIWVGLTAGLLFASVVLLLRFLHKSKHPVFDSVI